MPYRYAPRFVAISLLAGSIAISASAQQTQQAPVPLSELLNSTACAGSEYPEADADFLLTPFGELVRPARKDPVNEDQAVSVAVIADERLAPLLRVTRKSEFGATRISNAYGGDVEVPTPTRNPNQRSKCVATSPVIIRNFKPGQGVLEIWTQTDQAKQVTGTFDFRVNELYTGIFSLGIIRTKARNPTFGTVSVSRDTVISNVTTSLLDTVVTETDGRGDRVLYTLTYVPFVWGKQDLSVEPSDWFKRINPMVGVVLNDIANNALLGINVTLPTRISFMAGVHAARVTILDPSSGLTLGDRVEMSEVPVTKEWQYHSFAGVSVDLHIGAKLFKSVLGAATK